MYKLITKCMEKLFKKQCSFKKTKIYSKNVHYVITN